MDLKPTTISWPHTWIHDVPSNHLDSSFHGKTVVLSAQGQKTLRVLPSVRVCLVEVFTQPSESYTHLVLQPNSDVTHVRLQVQPRNSTHMSRVIVDQQSQSAARIFTINSGANLAKMDTEVKQTGAQADTTVEGLYLAHADQFVENVVHMHHSVGDGKSRQLFKGLVAEKSRARFVGHIRIDRDAQKVDSQQLSSALVLGRHAEIETRPELEILADDVKASHGASVGQMDPEQLFYLRSRGLSLKTAVYVLARGFLDEILFHIPNPELCELIFDRLEPSLGQIEQKFLESARS